MAFAFWSIFCAKAEFAKISGAQSAEDKRIPGKKLLKQAFITTAKTNQSNDRNNYRESEAVAGPFAEYNRYLSRFIAGHMAEV